MFVSPIFNSSVLAKLSGIITEEIRAAYPVEQMRNMGQVYMERIQNVNRDTFQAYKDMRALYKRYKQFAKRNLKGLCEIQDLFDCWHALAESGTKTAVHLNDLKLQSQKKYNEILAKRDEISKEYKEGILQLKRLELHRNLRKDPNVTEHLIDIYYNEKSMDQFRNSLIA